MFLLLLGAGAIYFAMGDPHEALILLGFVVIIMVITILQQYIQITHKLVNDAVFFRR